MNGATVCLPVLVLAACEGDVPDPVPDAPAVQRETVVPAGLVELTVGAWRDDGCLGPLTVQWPEVYWSEQAHGACRDNDRDYEFRRDGVCYFLIGSCPNWMDDPLVEVVEGLECWPDAVCPFNE